MQPHLVPTASRKSRLPHRTPLASCLALALGLSAVSSASMAGDRGFDPAASPIMRVSDVTGSKLDPREVFANIQKWRTDHPLPHTGEKTLGGNTLVVANCNNDGVGSMRAAIAAAASGDTIDMSELDCSTIQLDDVVLFTQDALTLQGSIVSGLPRPIITRDPGNTGGLLVHGGVGVLEIEDLTLSGGVKYGFAGGGCVRSGGSVRVEDTIIDGCLAWPASGGSSTVRGGGISAANEVYLRDSVVSDNSARNAGGIANGGGVYAGGKVSTKYSAIISNVALGSTGQSGGIFAGDGASIKYSTISNNIAGDAGGIHVTTNSANGGLDNVLIDKSTISGNHATDSSGIGSAGVSLTVVGSGEITIKDTTITGNVTDNSGDTAGLFVFGPQPVTLENTLISFNFSAFTGFDYDFETAPGVTVSGNHNLVGWVDTGDGGSSMPADTIDDNFTPMGPLQDNGGPTPTHAIGTGSWAFNRGQSAATIDQRGLSREVGTGVDIGSFESDALFIDRFEEPPLNTQ